MKSLGRATILLATVAVSFIACTPTRTPTDTSRAEHRGEAPSGPVRVQPEVDPDLAGIGERVPDLTFRTIDGGEGRLSDYRNHKTLVIAMRDVQCPVCRRYGPRLAQLEERFAARDVAFLFLNVSTHDSIPDMREEQRKYGFEGRYVTDPEARLGRALGARSTTEVFVLDSARTLRYRGAVDDQYGIGFARSAPRVHYLSDALEAVLAGERVPVRGTSAPGCFLDLKPAPETAVPVTYHNRISRIFEEKCVECHRQGGSSSIPLDRYDPVVGRREMVRFTVDNRTMPPWFAAPGSGPWSNDASLTAEERTDILEWIASGAPEGEASAAPRSRKRVAGWSIGEPELVLELPRAVDIPAEGTMSYQYLYVQNPLEEDRWISSVEIRPTAPIETHHVLVFDESSRSSSESQREFERRFQGGLAGYLAMYVPGQGATRFPHDHAKKLPGRCWLRFQLHYQPSGSAARDRTRIGFTFADGPPQARVFTASAFNQKFTIPAGAAHHEVQATYTFEQPSRLLGFAPHMHLRGKAFRYELVLPDGLVRSVLDIAGYDFNWQLRYQLREPIAVAPGTVLRATAWYDNSAANPANPDPKQPVGFGLQTEDEMMIGYFDWFSTAE